MNTIDELFEKFNWPTRTVSDDTNLLDIERRIEFELPMDYKGFLLKYVGHEMQIGEEFIKLWGKEELLILNQAYKIFENLPRTIGIGSNGAAEFIGIEKQVDGQLRMILSPFIDLDKQYHVEIGSSFTDFLLKLHKGEKWFKDIERQS